MEPALIHRFEDQRIPRYTSYPTAPHFGPAVGEATYRAWLGAIDPDARLSLYLHVPFCASLCWYCGCHTMVPGHDGPIERYVDALAREAELVADSLRAGLRVAHVHWGGGTPTIIGPDRFRQLMATLRRHFAIADEAELAIEIDPRRLSEDMVAALAASGISRASLGVQSFDPAVQRAVNRDQSFEATAWAVSALRRAGIERINVDLLYGLPLQTVAACEATVARVLELEPDRFAVFGYAHLPSLKRHQQRIDETALPQAAQRLAQAEAIAAALQRAGYVAIGLDHFARPEDGLADALRKRRLRRNFQGYTTDDADVLIGLGASSISACASGYAQNLPRIGAYIDAVLASRLPIARGLALSDDDRLRRDIIERLMCYLEVDLAAAAAAHGAADFRFDRERAILADLARAGVLRLDGDRIVVDEECRPLLRVVAAAFDAYLDAAADRHARAL